MLPIEHPTTCDSRINLNCIIYKKYMTMSNVRFNALHHAVRIVRCWCFLSVLCLMYVRCKHKELNCQPQTLCGLHTKSWLHLFVPTPLCSYTPMFLHIHPYVPTPLCSYTPMFRQPMFLHPYVPTTYVPTPLCSYTPMFLHPMFLHPYVPTPLCSYAPIFLPPLYSDTFTRSALGKWN